MIDGDETPNRGFSLVEHPMSPRALAAPLRLHTREDEYSYILEGRMGALLGDEVVEAGPGDLVFKPRNPVAHVLERGRRAVPDPRDHRASRVQAVLRRAGRPRRRAGGRPGGARGAEPALRARDAARASRAARALRPSDRRAALVELEDRQHVAGQVLEPGDRRALPAHDPALVLVEALVAARTTPWAVQIVNRLIDAVDREVEDRVLR